MQALISMDQFASYFCISLNSSYFEEYGRTGVGGTVGQCVYLSTGVGRVVQNLPFFEVRTLWMAHKVHCLRHYQQVKA